MDCKGLVLQDHNLHLPAGQMENCDWFRPG